MPQQLMEKMQLKHQSADWAFWIPIGMTDVPAMNPSSNVN
jgi:hypothetical protein